MTKIKILFASSVLMFSSMSLAMSVTQVKDTRLLIDLQGESASVDSEFYVINAQGKKVAIVHVRQVKGGKAIADIVKGTAKPGYTLQPRTGGGSSSAGGSSASSSDDSYYEKKLSQRARSGNSIGVVGDYLMNSMSANFNAGPSFGSYPVTSAMSGSGLGVLGYFNYTYSPSITLKGMAGMEQYNVSGSTSTGTADCSGTLTCNVKLTYLSFYGYGVWNYYNAAKMRAWLGLGGGYLYAASKSSTVLNQSALTANQIFVFAAGTDIRMTPKMYIPISVEYGMFPPSSTVKASIIYLRAGLGWYL